jgi:hypothetical protein
MPAFSLAADRVDKACTSIRSGLTPFQSNNLLSRKCVLPSHNATGYRNRMATAAMAETSSNATSKNLVN